MKLFKCKVILIGLLLALAIAVPVLAQTIKPNDDTTLKQIIIFGRHSIRSSSIPSSTLAQFSHDTYAPFTGVPVGYLTPNGREAAQLMGGYFNAYLTEEGLLTGNTSTDLPRLYFRANSIQRSNITASFFGAGLIPGATVPVHSYELGTTDPIFDPIAAGFASMDPVRAVTEVQGIYGTAAALQSAYSGELSLISSVLYPPGTQPSPGPQGSIDPTTQAFTLVAYNPITNAGAAINVGGLNTTTAANDPFIMQYADGFASQDVAWGRLTPDTLSQQTRLTALQMNIAMRTPYLAQVQSSNAASHVLRSMMQAVSGTNLRGAFGTPRTPVLVIIGSDYYVAGLAGLLGVHWQLPTYQPDFVGPGGMLVFELRQSTKTKGYVVRVFYTAQSLDQLRGLTQLSLGVPPATMQLTVPGGSNSATDQDVPFAAFRRLMTEAIGQKYVQPLGREIPPGVLDNVPLD